MFVLLLGKGYLLLQIQTVIACKNTVVKTGVCTKRHIFLKPSDSVIRREDTQTHQIQSSCSFYPLNPDS